ncbi:MAG: insulinase family protein [Syntrophales bacterium]|nr:insulinase family protein [Syntrophales bacterium]
MTVSMDSPAPTLSTGEKLGGFRILRIEQIPDIRVTAYEIEHEMTGAKVLHLHCDDRENLYAIGFRTPLGDSTGIPHILEHAVLAGSERYPLKDVFNELVKGTLQTFINAFTYPDKTIYPVASQVRKDFFNLARVYTDLVLRPRLLQKTFYQEGHHLEFSRHDDITSELVISGIVYNEMKGAYSSPDTLMSKEIQQNLFPDTTYAFDAGGDPDVIPSLTHEQLKAFHRTYYSPTNARIFLYGDIPTTDHLVFLEEMLAGFERVPVNSSIKSQTRWPQPASVHSFYPIGREEDARGKTVVNCAWMIIENTDHETVLLLEIVSGALVGSAAGPLRKALIDSGLGEDLSPITGLERDLKQVVFAVGLRGSDPGKAGRIESLILDTLQKVAETGFDRELIEATLHQVEFHGREIVRNSLPYGIILMGRAYHTWLYDGDPLTGMNFPRIIKEIRDKWEARPELFQDIVRTWFLDNPHRLLSVLEPSKTLQEEMEETSKKRMSRFKASLSREELENIHREAASLRDFQTEPDPPEASATLPKIKISDLRRTVETIPTEKTVIAGVPAMVHDIFANGVAYLDLAFNISDIPEDLQIYLPLLGKLMINMGVAGLTYEEMAKRIALKMGGIGCHLTAGMVTDGRGNWQKMVFRMKALHRNIIDAVRIISDILISGDLSDDTRLWNLLAERKNRLHASVIPSGHIFARRAAGAAVSVPAYRDEQWHGRTQFRFLNGIADQFNEGKGELQEKLAHLKEMIFRRERLILNLTADAEGLAILTEGTSGLVERLAGDGGAVVSVIPDVRSSIHRGIAIPAQVSYVAMVMSAPAYADSLVAPLLVAARYLSSGYLYKHIRVQGGAYGGMSQYDPISGLFALLSYRDPHIVRTLKVYDEAIDFICQNKLTEEELEKAVIGTIGILDKPMDPSSRGYVAMIRDFIGLTDEDRQKLRDEILDTTADRLQKIASCYFISAAKSAVIAVYAAEDELRKANQTLETKLEMETLI